MQFYSAATNKIKFCFLSALSIQPFDMRWIQGILLTDGDLGTRVNREGDSNVIASSVMTSGVIVESQLSGSSYFQLFEMMYSVHVQARESGHFLA